MAVRLQLKLGVIADQDRAPDSPDAALAVEPSIGSTARSKGNLYLLVTSRVSSQRASEAAQLAADTIERQYYYDESAGIRICLQKAIVAANQRLLHGYERLIEDDSGPLGLALAVVRSGELYVVTLGPAEAYLVRNAHLSTLPDPSGGRGLPARDVAPDVWRGEMLVGDSLLLASSGVVAKVGTEEFRHALVTLHPQSAVEHLHHLFVAAGGSGSDSLLAIEASEAAATQRRRALVPVRPAAPLAGAPDRSPIPLADSVSGGVAAVQTTAGRARAAATGATSRMGGRLHDLLPRRTTTYRRVTAPASRHERQRRAALAVIAFVVIAAALGSAMFLSGGPGPREAIATLTAGQQALENARSDVDEVFGPGVDLVEGDPGRAEDLLMDAYRELDAAAAAGIAATAVNPIRTEVIAGLERLYRVVWVRSAVAFSFDAAETPADLGALVRGPDGAPYVIDRATSAVYRIDLEGKAAVPIMKLGQKASGTKVGEPRLITVGGPDLLVLDADNVLWRWRPADKAGKGTLTKVKVKGSASWGDDILDIGTFVRNAEQGLYNLYIVDPSESQIMAYSPAADGSGFPASPNGRLATAQAVDDFASLYIDGDIWVIDGGVIKRFSSGKADGWAAAGLPDRLLRPAPEYALITAAGGRRTGPLYAYDPASERVVAMDKAGGSYLEQYLAADSNSWADIRGMYALSGIDGGPETLVWIDAGHLHTTVLEPTLARADEVAGGQGSPAEPSAPGSTEAPPAEDTPVP
jgi:hypothetical protein